MCRFPTVGNTPLSDTATRPCISLFFDRRFSFDVSSIERSTPLTFLQTLLSLKPWGSHSVALLVEGAGLTKPSKCPNHDVRCAVSSS